MNRNAIIIGATKRGAEMPRVLRSEIDRHVAANFYPTPPEATRALLSVEHFHGSVWEPACGNGAISKVLQSTGHNVISTDLNNWGFGTPGIDFLRESHPLSKHIITNPPYGKGLADDFIHKALAFATLTQGKVAMLLNLASLAHPSRTQLWRTNPPARIYPIDGVICWPDPSRAPPAHFRSHRYFWAVWEFGHSGPPCLWWLSAADFRNPGPHEFTALYATHGQQQKGDKHGYGRLRQKSLGT